MRRGTRPARRLTLIAALLLAALLAFALRDVIERTVILPLAYVWWLLGLYYQAVPEILLWTALLVLILFMLADSLLPEGGLIFSNSKPNAESATGPIEDLAAWMRKAPGGIYYKWLIANRLGKIARELLAQRDGRSVGRSFGPLSGRDWNPNDEMAAYLESGLNGSFAEYPRPRWPWLAPEPTPLDLSPEEAVAYLESQIREDK